MLQPYIVYIEQIDMFKTKYKYKYMLMETKLFSKGDQNNFGKILVQYWKRGYSAAHLFTGIWTCYCSLAFRG